MCMLVLVAMIHVWNLLEYLVVGRTDLLPIRPTRKALTCVLRYTVL